MLTLHIGNKNYSSWSLRGWLATRLSGAPDVCVRTCRTVAFASGLATEAGRARAWKSIYVLPIALDTKNSANSPPGVSRRATAVPTGSASCRLTAAWREPGAWDGETTVGGVTV